MSLHSAVDAMGRRGTSARSTATSQPLLRAARERSGNPRSDRFSDRRDVHDRPDLPLHAAIAGRRKLYNRCATHREDAAKRVLVVQDYVPAYRVAFFDALAVALAAHGYHLVVAHANTAGRESPMRSDARRGHWSQLVRRRRIRLGRFTITFRPAWRLARASHTVVVELASTNIDAYLYLADPRIRTAVWGHGKNYVSPPSRLDEWIETALAKRADVVLVYTNGGAESLWRRGVERSKITVLQNSTDVGSLRSQIAMLSAADVQEFRTTADLGTGPIAAFVGALDSSKNLPLLFSAVEKVHRVIPSFQLLVAGSGPLQAWAEEAARGLSCVKLLPYASTEVLALISAVADCVVMPGRVGLVAVDALAMGLPVVTTEFAYHAPEFEYLGRTTSIRAAENAEAFAEAVASLLLDRPRVAAMQKAAHEAGARFGIEQMVEQFLKGLDLPPR